MLIPGMKLPDFKTVACVSVEPDKEFKQISNRDYPGKWLVLYSYPKDFTFVCPTEILAFDAQVKNFAQRGAVVLGGSTDNEYSHLAWRKSDEGLAAMQHPLLYWSPSMAQAMGILHPVEGVALRATFLIDPEGVVRFATANDLDVGRNVDEVLRVLDGLQTGELVACGWKKGQETLSQKQKAEKGAKKKK